MKRIFWPYEKERLGRTTGQEAVGINSSRLDAWRAWHSNWLPHGGKTESAVLAVRRAASRDETGDNLGDLFGSSAGWRSIEHWKAVSRVTEEDLVDGGEFMSDVDGSDSGSSH